MTTTTTTNTTWRAARKHYEKCGRQITLWLTGCGGRFNSIYLPSPLSPLPTLLLLPLSLRSLPAKWWWQQNFDRNECACVSVSLCVCVCVCAWECLCFWASCCHCLSTSISICICICICILISFHCHCLLNATRTFRCLPLRSVRQSYKCASLCSLFFSFHFFLKYSTIFVIGQSSCEIQVDKQKKLKYKHTYRKKTWDPEIKLIQRNFRIFCNVRFI